MTGSLIISVDIELAWGVWDRLKPEHLRLTETDERPIVAALIDLFDQHEVVSTWAVVAAVLDEKAAKGRPGSSACWYAPDIIERLATARIHHEIGTHGGKHIYFDRASKSDVEQDLSYAKTIHCDHGLPFLSMVFPRNAVAHLPQLAAFGLRTFRSPDADWATFIRSFNTPAGQVANLTEKALPFPPPVVEVQHCQGMVAIPGSMLLMGRNGARRFILPFVTRMKLKRGLDHAQHSDSIFHLWFHPSNFYYRREEQLATLDWFLGHAADEAGKGNIEIRTLGSYAEKNHTSATQTVSESK